MSLGTVLITVVLLLANAFFVAAEFAIVKIRPSRLGQLAARGQGGRGARSTSLAGMMEVPYDRFRDGQRFSPGVTTRDCR